MVIFLKTELSTLNIKNLLYFLERKFFLYFRKWNSALFRPSSKNKRNPPLRKFFILQETKIPEKFLIFSKKDAFLYFETWKPRKSSSYFRNGNFLYFTKGIFRTRVYSKPETYSEHCQTSRMERFAKIAT